MNRLRTARSREIVMYEELDESVAIERYLRCA